MTLSNKKPIMKISSSKLKKNINLYRKISGDAEVGCVLKSNAYGCGLKIISKFLNSNGIKTFFVATHDEAEELANYLKIKSMVYVLADFWRPLKIIKKAQIISIASTFEDLIKLEKFNYRNKNIPSAIHLDCGLNRYGIKDSPSVRIILKKIESHSSKNILVIAHLSHSDESQSNENVKQLNNLLDFKKDFVKFKYSISGSAGVINSNNFSLELIRPGLSLFGANSTDSPRMKNFENVINLIAPIVQIKTIKKDEGVGYNHKYLAKKTTYIATAKIGYADGIDRELYKKGFKVFFNKKSFDIVGRISMDLITFKVDKTLYEYFLKRPETTHYVELINDIQNPTTISLMLDTIPHEVLTRLSNRIERKLVK